jgi:polysaccharide export outer membrane protein
LPSGAGAIPVPGAGGHEPRGTTAALNTQLFQRAATPATPGDLPLGPGDLIEVVVFEVPELSNLKVRVSRPGIVVLPLIGQIPVTGKTPAELEADLRERLGQRFMHDPHVTVFVHERKSQRISVIGAVRKGGVFELSGRLRLADALAMAEGLADDADHMVYLFRRVPAGTVAQAQARAAPPAGSPPSAGAPPPGPPPAAPPPGAASPASDSGATEEVMTAINLDAMAKGADELNVQLEAGDVIHVPRAGSIYVGGSVARPGSMPLKVNTTVHQAILAAGGVSHVAALADVRLYRTNPDGQISITELDLNEFEAGKGSPVLQKNDVVIVGKSAAKAIFWGVYDLFRGMFGIGVGL